MQNYVAIKVYNGNKTFFWKDRWLGNRSLTEMFPDLSVLAQQQDKTMADMWSPQDWDLSLRRKLDWEIRRKVELEGQTLGK